MEHQSSLPEAWVDRIFDKLSVTYGAAWMRKWEGVDGSAVKADWGHELRGFQQSPHAIKHALEHLPPDEPPTVLQFRGLCIKAPQYVQKQLEDRRPASPESVALANDVKARIGGGRAGIEWAHALRERENGGEKLTITVRSMWRDALRHEVAAEAQA